MENESKSTVAFKQKTEDLCFSWEPENSSLEFQIEVTPVYPLKLSSQVTSSANLLYSDGEAPRVPIAAPADSLEALITLHYNSGVASSC